MNENISTVADSEKTIKVGETASLKSSDYKSRKYSHIWSITSGNDVIKLTGSGYKVTAEGLKEGTATVSDWIYRYSLYHTTITYTVRVTSSEKVTVKPAIVYYLKDPTKDANSNDTGHWGDAYGNATVNVEGAKWVNDKNCFNGLSQRVVSWPNNTNVIPKNSTHWNAIFNEYKASIQTQLGGVKITADDVEEITLVPAKISKNNGTDPDLHLDCNVNIKCKSVALVKYYLFDANGTNWEMLGSKNYIVKDTSTTKPGDVTSRTFPETKTVNGVTYKFSGWYTDENLTQRAPEFPAKVTGSVNYYAKYTAEYKVSYNLAGGKFSDDSTSAEEKHNADTTVTVKEEPTRAGYEFIGWTVEGLGTTTTLDSGETFTMPNRDVTLTAKWEEQKIEEFLTLVPKDVSKPYDGTELQAGTAKVTGKVEGADTASVKIEYSLNGTDWTTNPSEVTATNVSDSKTVQVRATSEKYTGELTGTEELTITPKPVTVTANSYNKTYGASDPEFTVTVVGTLGTDKVTYNLSREAGEDVGTYPITASGDAIQGNYNVTYHPGTLTITAATRPEDRQLGVTSYEGVYDANEHTITVDNVLDGDVVEYSYDGGETWTTNLNQYKDVTETTIKVRVTNANYDPNPVELEGTVKITPKPVTVTANSYNKAYGATDPEFTATVEGTLGSDTVNYKLNRETGEDVGTYKILAIGDAAQGNYSVTYYPGTLTITAATRPEDRQLGVTSYEGVYDANEHTITVDNVLDGDVVEYSYDGGETWTTNLNQYKDVTETTIKVRVTNANYDPSPVELEGTVKITPATLTVSTPIATKVYEGTPLTAAGTISGFVNDETATFATTGSQTEVGSTANTYSLTWDGTAKESNYKVVETIGTLTVTAQSIDPDNPNYKGITVDAPTDVEYTGEDQTWLPTVTDGNGKALVKDTDYTVTYDNEDRTNVTGIITVTINGAGNYAGTITRTYQITPKPVTITTESKTKAFDGTALTAGGKVEGIVSGETYGFKTTGSQTYVGSSQNTYEMVWADSEVEGTSGTYTAKKTNYTVTESIGTLAVTAGTPENPLDPTLVVNKTHDKSQTYKAGDVITFTITAKNIYEEAKTITLEELEGVALDANVFENVAPGAEVTATATYTVTEQDIVNGTFTNNVTVTFSGVDDKFTGTDTVDELEDANPHMTITKTTVGAEEGHIYKLGEVINYKITATNDGNLTLTNVKVEDALTGNVGENAFTIDTLAPDEAQTFDVRYVVTENDVLEGKVINNATGTATDPTDPDEPKTPVTPGEKEDPIETPNPSLAVVKTSDKTGVVKLGETITYTITVTNNGNVTINDIEVTDELTGNTGDNAFTIDRLAVGETKQFTATYTVTEDDILEGTIVNRATATGKDPRNEEVTGEGEVRVDTEEKDDSKKDDSKKNDSDKKPGAVKTGDATDVIPFFGMTVLAAGAAIVIALKKKRRA